MKKSLMIISSLGITAVVFAACSACSKNDTPVTPDPDPVEPITVSYAKGADVSWLTQMESEGITFQTQDGETMECMKLLRDECGVNAIRLRVWVNPEEGWNNIPDVVVKARRAAALGLAVMIDFHFSDTWADPSHQAIPAAWADMTIDEAAAAVKAHVTEMLTALKEFDVTPQWVQIGNETRGGMMYPLGEYTNGTNYATLVNAGYDAVKAIFSDCIVIVHLDGGDNINLYNRIFGYLKTNGGKYDMIGMSFYPELDTIDDQTDQLLANIKTVNTTYGKPVMICEIGLEYSEAAACKSMIQRIMDESDSSIMKGIFYWEPEAPAGYNGGYDKGCFEDGAPTEALDAFKE